MWLKLFLTVNYIILVRGDGSFTFPNPIRFPYGPVQGPFMGMFLAISLPLDLPDYNVFFSYNFEANYNLPQNESSFTYPPLLTDSSRSLMTRKYLYDILEFKLKSHGYPGRPCLLRTICEIAVYSPENTGILGDLLHLVLTPSTSINRNIKKDYEKAEMYGKAQGNCLKFHKKCPIDIIGLVSKVASFL